MGRRDEISLALVADIEGYAKGVSKIPGVTEKQAARAALAWAKHQDKLAIASTKAAKKGADSWMTAFTTAAGNIAAEYATRLGDTVWDRLQEVSGARTFLVNLAEDSGVAIDRLDGLRLAVGRTGEDFEDIGDGLRDFGEILFDFSNGGGRAEETLRELDVSVLDANHNLRDTTEVFDEVVGKLQDIENPALRAAYAQQLMGDNGAKMLRALDGRKLSEWVEYAREFGLKTAPEAAKGTRRWENATNEFGVVFDSVIADVINAFGAEDAAELVRRFTTGFTAVTTWLGTWGTATVKRVEGIGTTIREVMQDALEQKSLKTSTTVRYNDGSVETFTNDRAAKARERLSELLDFTEDIDAATERALKKVGTLIRMQGSGDNAPAGGRGGAPRVDADAVQAAKDAAEQLDELYTQLRVSNLQGMEAIDARYDLELRRIDELQAASGDLLTAQLAADEIEKQREREKADLRIELARKVADEVGAAMEREREARARAAASEKAQRESTLSGLSMMSSSFAGFTDTVLGGYDAQTKAGKQAMHQQAVAAKLFTVFDLALKQVQAVANVAAKSDPYSMFALIGTTVGLFAGLVSTASSLQVPKAHSGTPFGVGGSGRPWMPDEQMRLTKRDEVIVEAPTVRDVGGPQGVRDRLEGSRGGPEVFILDLGDEQLEVIGRKSRRDRRVPTDFYGWST